LILVSSNMEEIAEVVDRVFVVDAGRTLLAGATREVFSRPVELRRLGLEAPPVAEIVNRLAEQGAVPPGSVLDVEEAKDRIWRALNSSATSP
jgi:energy-coupling factor transport system ATP-binding protein